MISTKVLKLGGVFVLKLLEIIFKSCLKENIFSDEWKKVSVVLIHTKKLINKFYQIIDVFLLSICSKIFESLIYNSINKHISDNNLLSPNWSGFCTGDSCINQLYLIHLSLLAKKLKLEQYFQISSKLFTKPVTKDLFISCTSMILQGLPLLF